jgi:hypothetical protein
MVMLGLVVVVSSLALGNERNKLVILHILVRV